MPLRAGLCCGDHTVLLVSNAALASSSSSRLLFSQPPSYFHQCLAKKIVAPPFAVGVLRACSVEADAPYAVERGCLVFFVLRNVSLVAKSTPGQ